VVSGSVKAVEGVRGYRQLTLAPHACSANASALTKTRLPKERPSMFVLREAVILLRAWYPCPRTTGVPASATPEPCPHSRTPCPCGDPLLTGRTLGAAVATTRTWAAITPAASCRPSRAGRKEPGAAS